MGRREELNDRAKHGSDFYIAVRVFEDPYALDREDRSMDYDEIRRRITGFVGDRLVTVIYTERHDRLRVISARRPSTGERHAYEESR